MSAQSESFNIQVFGGTDTEAPTTPVLSATAIAPTQVDVTWTTATDNFAVAGYVITRGTSTIATTTLTNFSDTGVSASTTYSYSVQAFDAAFNYSSSSNIFTVTTANFPVVVPVESGGSSEGTFARVVIDDFTIAEGLSAASITFNTPRPTLITVRWGRTTSYELGYLVNETFSRNHILQLTDLEPGTTYEYEIIAATPFGLESVVQSGQFTTLSNVATQSPSNVARFSAVVVGTDVRLSWQNPVAEEIAYVRVVRSHLDFPRHPQDGATVYQGSGNSVTDRNILSQFSPVYYTVFTYGLDGKISSGAITWVVRPGLGQSGSDMIDAIHSWVPVVSVPVKIEQATSTVYPEFMQPEMRIPELSEVYVKQAAKEFSFAANQMVLADNESFTVTIPARAISGNLKSIIGTLVDPTDNRKQYSFLLRINQDQTAYEATVSALNVQGESVLMVEIYDYQAATVATYKTPVDFVATESAATEVVFPDVIVREYNWLLLASVIPFIGTLLFLLIFRYKTEDKQG